MTRTTIFRSNRMAIAMVGALMAPTFAFSQDSTVTSRTHSCAKAIRCGTSLASTPTTRFAGSRCYDLNTATVRDPHWIYPGERLRLPGAAVADNTADRASRRPLRSSAGERRTATDRCAADRRPVGRRQCPHHSMHRRCSAARRRTAALSRTARDAGGADAAGKPHRPSGLASSTPRPMSRAPVVLPNAGRIVGTGDVPGIPLTETRTPAAVERADLHHRPPGMSIRGGRPLRRAWPWTVAGRHWSGHHPHRDCRRRARTARSGRRGAHRCALCCGRDRQRARRDGTSANGRPAPRAAGERPANVSRVDTRRDRPAFASIVRRRGGGSASGMRVGDQITFYRERRTTLDGVCFRRARSGGADCPRDRAGVHGPRDRSVVRRDQEGTAARVSARCREPGPGYIRATVTLRSPS